MADTSKVEIKIQTTADTAGATQTAAALDKVGTSAAKAGGSVGANLTAALKEQRTAGKDSEVQALKGGEAFEKLANASRGGAQGILSIIPAIRGLGAAFLANPIGAAVAAFFLLKDAAAAAGRGIGDYIVKGRQLADNLSNTGANAKITATNLDAIKEAGDKALAKVAADAKAAADDMERFYKGVDEAKKRLDALADAALAAKLAELDLAEAQALAGATTETGRETIRQDFAGQRTAARRASAAAGSDRERRFETERQQTAQGDVAGALDRIASAQSAYNAAATRLSDQLETNKGLSASTPEGQEGLRLAAIARAEADAAAEKLRSAQDANNPIVERGRAEAQRAATAIAVLDQRDAAAKNTTLAEDITTAPKNAAALNQAKAADAQAAALSAIGGNAGALGAGAANIGADAKASGDTGLFDASKVLSEAAKAAQTDGTTKEEAQALLAAATELAQALKERDKKFAALDNTIRLITEQLKNARTQ